MALDAGSRAPATVAPFRVLIIGGGVQGEKRRRFAADECVGVVDPVIPGADFRHLEDAPRDAYDAAIVCTPDGPKTEIVEALVRQGKHVLVEKPFWAAADAELARIENLARANRAFVLTAYNHRFEPHFQAMRELIASRRLGRLYRCRLFYGNGTARLVRESAWRDQGSGVLHDLGSHLLDTARYWFDDLVDDLEIVASDRFENQAPDHVALQSRRSRPRLELEMSLVSWRNHFTADLYAEKGSAHVTSLCKWGPSAMTVRTRILPSGRPPEETQELVREDPTWAMEYGCFRQLARERAVARLENDIWLNRTLRKLGRRAVAMADDGARSDAERAA